VIPRYLPSLVPSSFRTTHQIEPREKAPATAASWYTLEIGRLLLTILPTIMNRFRKQNKTAIGTNIHRDFRNCLSATPGRRERLLGNQKIPAAMTAIVSNVGYLGILSKCRCTYCRPWCDRRYIERRRRRNHPRCTVLYQSLRSKRPSELVVRQPGCC